MADNMTALSKRPRSPRLRAESVCLICPACDEPVPNLQGSEMWTEDDFQHRATAVCACGTLLKLPRVPTRVPFG